MYIVNFPIENGLNIRTIIYGSKNVYSSLGPRYRHSPWTTNFYLMLAMLIDYNFSNRFHLLKTIKKLTFDPHPGSIFVSYSFYIGV